MQVLELIFGYFGGWCFPYISLTVFFFGTVTTFGEEETPVRKAFPPWKPQGLDGIPPERAVYPLTFHDARSGWREGRGQGRILDQAEKNSSNGSDGVDPAPEVFFPMTNPGQTVFLKIRIS